MASPARIAVAILIVTLFFLGAGATRPSGTAPSLFRDCRGCPEMVRVPAGEFVIGSPVSDLDSDPPERPQKRVHVAVFALGRYPVTRAEYAAFVAATGRKTEMGCAWTRRTKARPDPLASWRDTSFPQTPRHPIVCITWEDVSAYLVWLRAKTGKAYRLATESEWEYAARAGTSLRFPWGDAPSHDFANYGAEEFGTLVKGRDRWLYTSPVDAFSPNRFGIYDMNGNALEFVADCYSVDYSRLPTDGSAFLVSEQITASPIKSLVGRNSCSLHMLRGGDWGDPGRMVRSAYRNVGPAPYASRSTGVGFRVALSL